MKTSAVWILLAAIACLQAQTSLRMAHRITGLLAEQLNFPTLDAAGQAVADPTRMVRLTGVG